MWINNYLEIYIKRYLSRGVMFKEMGYCLFNKDFNKSFYDTLGYHPSQLLPVHYLESAEGSKERLVAQVLLEENYISACEGRPLKEVRPVSVEEYLK